MTSGIDGWDTYCILSHFIRECVSFLGVNCTISRAFSTIEDPQSGILMVGAFPESKVAPRCKKKEEGLQSNLPSPKTYFPLGLFASCP